MSSQGVVLDIDTQFLERLRRADEELRKIVGSVDNVTTSFTRLITTAGGQNKTVFEDLAKQFEKIGSTKITANVDLSQLEKLMSTITDISSVMGAMSAKGKPLFDVKGIADSNAGIIETEKALADVEKRINSLRQSYENTSAGFVASINPRTGAPYKSGKKYEEEKAAYMADDGVKAARAEIEMQLKAEMEQKAILTRQLEFAKMTQDEKAQYVQKKIEQMLSEEKAFASQVQKEYLATVKEMTQVGGKHDKASAKNSDGSLTPQLEKYEMRFIELNDKRIQMEKQYGAYIYDVAVEAQSKIADLEIKRILDRKAAEKKANEEAVDRYRSTPIGALQFAGSAQTVSEMREAMKYLQTARDNTNVKDEETIKALNKKYLELRATIESLTTAEKNENSLQPSIRNEYLRLQRELEKVAEAKKQLAQIQVTPENQSQLQANSSALLAREADLQARITEIKTAAGDKIETAENQYLAEKAAREIAETQRVEDEKVRIAKQKYQEAQNALMEIERLQSQVDRAKLTSGGTANTAGHDATLKAQRDAANAEIQRIEREHGEAVQAIREKYQRKRIQSELETDRQSLANTKYIDAQIQQIIDKAHNMSKWDAFKSKFSSGKLIDTTSVDGAIAAINKLKEARDRLNKDDFGGNTAKYQRALNHINQEIQRQETHVERLRASHTRLKKDAEQLKSTLQRVFGLAAIKSFTSKLVGVRGEFEMQQRSLEVLLRNKGEADLLWQRTVDLAVKSPYTTQQLVTATKQLAAYRVESHKLFSTTKMLTDISAGLGVEINRLVLAYGQVKAANFLRGTELRQFSEAGVNLLDELAEYYTQLEGKAVTVQQVFDRISKRMVSFQDVDAVLQRITSAGGIFYNMQEQQSETLKGQILNLKDSVELMLNDMGSSVDGVIKKIVSGLKWVVDHWKIFAIIIGPTITTLLGMKAVVTLWRTWTASQIALNRAMNANPIFFWAGVIATVVGAIISFVSAASSVSEELTSQLTVFHENTSAINGYAGAVVNLTEKINELTDIKDKTIEQETELERATRARATALGELSEMNAEYAKSLRDAGNDVERMTELMQEENTRQKTTSNFLSNISEIDISELDSANASLAKAYAMYEAIMTRFEQVDPELTYQGSIALKRALEDCEGDLSKLESLYKEYVKEMNEYATPGDIFSRWDTTSLGDKQINEWWHELKSAYKDSLESDDVKAEIREAVSISFERGQVQGIKDGIAKGKGTPEYQDAIRQLRAQYNHIVKQAGDSLGKNGQDVVLDELTKMFDLTQTWLTDSEPVSLDAWAESYNEAIATIVDSTSSLYNTLLATEQDTVSKKISALRQEKAERETLINTLLVQIAAEEAAAKSGVDNSEKLQALKDSLAKNQSELATITTSLGFLGVKDKKNGGGGRSGQDKWEKSVKTIKDVYKAYSKLSEKFSKDVATKKLWEQWSDVINENLKDIGLNADKVREKFGDLTSEESITKALEYIAQNGSKKGKRAALELIAEVQLEFEIKEQDKAFERLKNTIESQIKGYELYIELSDLGIPKDFMSKFFTAEVIELPELRAEIISKKADFENFGDPGIEEYNRILREIDEMEAKAQQDRLKKYLDYTKSTLSEIGQIKVDQAKEAMDIIRAFEFTDTLAFNEGLISQDTLDRMRAAGKTMADILVMNEKDAFEKFGITKEQHEALLAYNNDFKALQDEVLEASKTKADAEIAKHQWASFKESDTFAQIFNDLENASDALIESAIRQIEEFKSVWSSLDPAQFPEFSEILKKYDELQRELAESSPRDTRKRAKETLTTKFKSSDKSYVLDTDTQKEFGLAGEYQINQDFISPEAQERLEKVHGLFTSIDFDYLREALEAEAAALDAKIINSEREVGLLEAQYEEYVRIGGANSKLAKDAKAELDTKRTALNVLKANRRVVQDGLDVDEERRDALKGQAEKIQAAWDLSKKLLNSCKDLADVFLDDDSPASAFAEMGINMADTVINTIVMIMQLNAATIAAEGFGAAMKSATGIIGWIIMAIELIAMGLKAIFNAKDKSILKDIETEQKAVEKLQKGYEELEKSLERAYSSMEIGRLTKDMNDNLEQQKAHTEEMIRLEQSRKKPDQDKIDDWRDEIDELEQQMAENIEDTFNILTNGILENVLDVTRNFVDAWYDAFKETGDGMSGLKDTFKDMLLDMLKQQASTTLISPFIAKLQKQIYDSVIDDNIFDPEEARDTKEMWDGMMPQIDESLKNYFEAFEGVLGQGNGELSDLQKGIQGMTEDQAEVLAAYWNSCRFMLSNIDTNIAMIATEVLEQNQTDNPIVSAIKEQTAMVKTIKEMLSGVISHDGKYVNVYMP